MVTTLVGLQNFQRQNPLGGAASADAPRDPKIAAEIGYWRETAPKVASVEAFLADERLVEFAGRAFGFPKDGVPSRGLLALAIDQGAADPGGFVNRTPDFRLEDMVREMGLKEFGLAKLRDPRFVNSLADRYRTHAETPGQGVAAGVDRRTAADIDYFKTRIGGVESPDDLIADLRLYNFALEAFGLEEHRRNPLYVKRGLTDGVTDRGDFANAVGDERLQDMARAFGFGEVGTAYVRHEQFGEAVARRVVQARAAEEDAGPRAGESADTAYFRQNIGKVKTVDDLLSDRRLHTYVMTAFDLREEVGREAITRRVLEDGLADEEGLAFRLNDRRYQDLALALGLAEFGDRNLKDADIVDDIAGRFERVAAETSVGETNPSVELAAYFDRQAGGLRSWVSVLADGRLREVAFTALQIPDTFSVMGIRKLVGELESRFPFADLADPEKRAGFIERYATFADAEGAAQGPGDPLLSLFGGNSGGGAENLYSLVFSL